MSITTNLYARVHTQWSILNTQECISEFACLCIFDHWLLNVSYIDSLNVVLALRFIRGHRGYGLGFIQVGLAMSFSGGHSAAMSCRERGDGSSAWVRLCLQAACTRARLVVMPDLRKKVFRWFVFAGFAIRILVHFKYYGLHVYIDIWSDS